MLQIPIHVIDFEGSRQSGIVEYGVVTLHGSRIDAVQTRVCAPIGTISDRDRMQHGLSEVSTARAAPFSQEWALFSGLRELGPFCAHNAAVEDGFLRMVWPYARNSPNFSEPGQTTPSWGPWLDTLHLYRRIYPQLEQHKLETLIATFQLQAELDELAELYCPAKRNHYHCALYDALASALLLRGLYQEAEFEGISLHWLFLNSAASESSRDAMGQQDLF